MRRGDTGRPTSSGLPGPRTWGSDLGLGPGARTRGSDAAILGIAPPSNFTMIQSATVQPRYFSSLPQAVLVGCAKRVDHMTRRLMLHRRDHVRVRVPRDRDLRVAKDNASRSRSIVDRLLIKASVAGVVTRSDRTRARSCLSPDSP
jgi:hypothetical protein